MEGPWPDGGDGSRKRLAERGKRLKQSELMILEQGGSEICRIYMKVSYHELYSSRDSMLSCILDAPYISRTLA